MDLDLYRILKESKLDKKDYNEVSKVLTRLLNEKYSKEVVLDKLVHQANFDKDVFMKYWVAKRKREDKPTCTLSNQEKALELGFDYNCSFGGLVVGLIDYYFEK